MSDYEVDFFAWTQRQGGLLRRLAAGERVNDADLDWPNIAEEIETLGRSERRLLTNQLATIIEHLVKLQASPAQEPRAGGRATIRRCRLSVEELLDNNPSLRPVADKLVADAMKTGRRLAEVAFEEYGERPRVDPRTLSYAINQVVGDWFPDEPQ
ncbi:MAG TPA: DUF29 domain-containing protein [Acetobacteraceae bacterium]|jgi:hypothetical protein